MIKGVRIVGKIQQPWSTEKPHRVTMW